MDAIINQLLIEVHHEFSVAKCLSSNILKSLWAVFRLPLLGALDIIDKQGVLRITSPSGRKVFEVTGKSGATYSCFSTGIYCTCPAFVYTILRRGEHLMCKHVLAARLADAMDLALEVQWTDQQIAVALCTLD